MRYPHQLMTTVRCSSSPDKASLVVWQPGTPAVPYGTNSDPILYAEFERGSQKLGWRVTAVEYRSEQAGFAIAELQNHYTNPDDTIRVLLTALLDSIR